MLSTVCTLWGSPWSTDLDRLVRPVQPPQRIRGHYPYFGWAIIRILPPLFLDKAVDLADHMPIFETLSGIPISFVD